MIKEFTQKDGKKLQLTEAAINHIVQGNFSTRPVKDEDNMVILSGGLHTYDSWIEFRNKHSDKLEHLHFFNSYKHQYWYYARELGNGVITLRLPRELFTGKAARITMYPDDYYKSGYLWKKLFPKGYDKSRILSVIEEALENEDQAQRRPGQIFGYINNNDPLFKMKVAIQFRGKEIKSAFPTWTQPNSGNNGKPYSHYDNIGFVIAQSTEYFNDKEKLNNKNFFSFSGSSINAEEIHLHTPTIFENREIPNSRNSKLEEARKRKEELKNYKASKEENDTIFNYLNDFTLVKFYPELLTGVYESANHKLSKDKHFYNTFQVVQNFVDGLYYLQLTNQTDRLTQTIIFMLNNMVSHTMLDLLSKKRIISTMINIVESENRPELSYKFIISLSTSPIRREAYIEYSLDSINKKKLNKSLPLDDIPDEFCVIVDPSLDIGIGHEDFIEILKEILGETYTLNFKEDKLNCILEDLIEQQSKNFRILLKHNLSHFTPEDLTSLSNSIGTILNSASKHTDGDKDKLITCVGLILRDYCRIQFAHRQRLNARYAEYNDYAGDLYLPIDHKLLFGTILKHERWINLHRLEEFTTSIVDFAKSVSSKELNNDANNFIKQIGKERPPLPDI